LNEEFYVRNYYLAQIKVITMKIKLSFVIAGLLSVLIFSCSKSDSNITNANKNEFGSINPFDSIVAAASLGGYYYGFSDGVLDSVFIPGSTAYYYFKYNSDGLPVLKLGGFIQLSAFNTTAFSSTYKDTLIYLDNHTIEMRTFPYGTESSSYRRTTFTFNNGYLIQKIYNGGSVETDTSIFKYNNSHQLISIRTTSNIGGSGIETQYVYNSNTAVAEYLYYIDPTTQEPFPNYTSMIQWQIGTNPNPYYKQEWLKMWTELVDRTILPKS
jgi:hypothetical protein